VSTLHDSQYFSVLDCYSGFRQLTLAEANKIKTAFSVLSGHYNFLRQPYGLANSPAIFQRLMDLVLRDLVGNVCYVFIDDVIVYGNTIEEHARRLRHVLERFDRVNLQLQPGKFVFAKPQIDYVGYIFSMEGFRASPEKTKVVRNSPVPRNVKDVRSFLGLASFYRRLMPNLAQIAKPMTGLLRKYARVTFGQNGKKLRLRP
jgi:hypothetical protein